jgi:hypothetical protein
VAGRSARLLRLRGGVLPAVRYGSADVLLDPEGHDSEDECLHVEHHVPADLLVIQAGGQEQARGVSIAPHATTIRPASSTWRSPCASVHSTPVALPLATRMRDT